MRLPVLLLLLAPLPLAAQQASFVYRLGKDTVAIEQYSRSANSVSGEMIQRSGAAVAVYRYEMSLGSNGHPTTASIRRFQQDGTPFPNQPVETRLTFTADSVMREVILADSTDRRAFAAQGAVMAFPVFIYGPMELLADLRDRGMSPVPTVGMTGNPGTLALEPAGGDTLRLRGAPYPMRLVFDASRRLQAVDGAGTTNKILATRGPGGLDLAAVARAMKPTGTLSARDVARGSFGPGGFVLIDYGRPLVRERTVWGGALVPFDSVWRAGANDATHLFTTRTLTFGDLTLPPGSYTLWVQHTRSTTWLIVNRQTGQWGTQYDPAQDVGRVRMTMRAAPDHVEELTYTIQNLGGNRGAIELAWGSSVLYAPFTVSAR
jgi:hypothetical protein